jgi:Ig-like domain CHU_C associated
VSGLSAQRRALESRNAGMFLVLSALLLLGNPHGVTLEPDSIVVAVGETVTAIAADSTPGAEVIFGTNASGLPAEVSGRIVYGQSSATIRITGVYPGVATIYYTVPNMGRAPGGGAIGTVLVVPCDEPVIVEQPLSAFIRAGQRATLTVRASGTSPVIHWYQGARLVGTGETFVTLPLRATTEYVAEVRNACGTVRSDIARVTVAARRRSIR